MENVTIVGTEAGVLVLATESGERFALPIDDMLQREIRRATRQSEPTAQKLAASPRDIQAQIRAGLTAPEVAELLGISVDDVARFEGPVLAEREHVIGQALAVPVLIGSEVEPDAQPTFGVAVRAKLAEIEATSERWASWKEDSGWTIKLEFTANDVDHDARWSFDPRRSTLSPQNSDAIQLSRQGSLPEGLIPRLRALDTPLPKDDTRFDSGAFGPRRLDIEDEPGIEATGPVAAAVQAAAIKRAPDAPVTSSETADLLEALRRRRGQREPLPGVVEAREPEQRAPSAPVALFDALEPEYRAEEPEAEPERTAAPPASTDTGRRAKGRPSMPSWDEIVFGARTDES